MDQPLNESPCAKKPQPSAERLWTVGRAGRVVIGMVLLAATLFVPAGRLDWWNAWAFLAAYLSYVVGLHLWLARHDRALLAERNRRADDAAGWDKVIIAAYSVLLMVMLITAALDAGRYHWTAVPLVIQLIAWAGVASAMALVTWVMKVNTFLSESARIQWERGHRVVTSGPYRYVRHPMYACVIVSLVCLPLILGSWTGLALAVPLVALFVARTYMEDRMLSAGLPGYSEYASRVRYRLVPGVW